MTKATAPAAKLFELAPPDFHGSGPTQQQREALREQGYVIVDNFLNPQQLAVMRAEAHRLAEAAKAAAQAKAAEESAYSVAVVS